MTKPAAPLSSTRRRSLPRLAAACLLAALTPSPATARPPSATPPARIIPPPLRDLGRDYKIRLVYFVPSDCRVRNDYRAKIEVLTRVLADVFRRDLTSNGHRTRGLDFEFDDDGRLKIHLLHAPHPAAHYSGHPPSTDHLFDRWN